ncbi:MAG TPA: phage tail protein [Blastocatellia bacterium]|nr:phage tail protein [Blastocatellia bacterium]
MSNGTGHTPSSLLAYLPSIYQEEAGSFLGQFLRAFEAILIAPEDGSGASIKSLEATIAGIATLFDPRNTPEEFLQWLAGWTAFSLRADLNLDQQRDFISKIIQLYSWRGTKRSLQDLLSIFTKGKPEITESATDDCQLGVNSTIGEGMWLGGGPAHFFQVRIFLPDMDAKLIARQMEIASALIEMEKPAHTFYELVLEHPTMQIGIKSTIGVDTLLGNVALPETNQKP